jgi:hypothetical protein
MHGWCLARGGKSQAAAVEFLRFAATPEAMARWVIRSPGALPPRKSVDANAAWQKHLQDTPRMPAFWVAGKVARSAKTKAARVALDEAALTRARTQGVPLVCSSWSHGRHPDRLTERPGLERQSIKMASSPMHDAQLLHRLEAVSRDTHVLRARQPGHVRPFVDAGFRHVDDPPGSARQHAGDLGRVARVGTVRLQRPAHPALGDAVHGPEPV